MATQPHDHDRLVIGFTGRIGAGKTAAAEYLNAKYGFQYLRYSQVLSAWKAKDPQSKAHLQEVGWDIMHGGMQAMLNARLISAIETGRNCAVDGLRHPVDYASLRGSFGSSFHLLYLEASPEKRWDRVRNRLSFKTVEEFTAADNHPVEQRIVLLRKDADEVIQNAGTLEQMYSAIDSIIKGLILEGRI